MSAPLSLDCTVVATRDQVAAALAEETVILGLRDGVYYGVDGVARLLWDRVQQPVALQALVADVVAQYEVDAARASADVLAFVADLEAHGLVTRVDPRPTP